MRCICYLVWWAKWTVWCDIFSGKISYLWLMFRNCKYSSTIKCINEVVLASSQWLKITHKLDFSSKIVLKLNFATKAVLVFEKCHFQIFKIPQKLPILDFQNVRIIWFLKNVIFRFSKFPKSCPFWIFKMSELSGF